MSRLAARVPLARLGLSSNPAGLLAQRMYWRNARRNWMLQNPIHRPPSIAAIRARFTSTSPLPSSSQQLPPLPEDATLSQRLKHLIKRYGFYAVGIYLSISALDFMVTFATIHFLGAEYVAKVTDKIKAHLSPIPYLNSKEDEKKDEKTGGKDSLYATAVLAFGIHKTLMLPVRVGITAAFTPRVVGWLAQRGWIGREGAKRAAGEMRAKMSRQGAQAVQKVKN